MRWLAALFALVFAGAAGAASPAFDALFGACLAAFIDPTRFPAASCPD